MVFEFAMLYIGNKAVTTGGISVYIPPKSVYLKKISDANVKSRRDRIIGGCDAWQSSPGNNDDAASCQHVHVYKHCHCIVLQFANASLNDPLTQS